MLADYRQTVEISKNCQVTCEIVYDKYRTFAKVCSSNSTIRETNASMGNCPDRESVDQHFAWSYLATSAITYVLPAKMSYTFQGMTAVIELDYVKHNINIGLQVKF